MARHPQILSTGSYVPERVVTNAEVDALMGESTHEWLLANVGIRERRWMAPDQVTSDLIVEASKKALDRAGLTAADIDLIIVSTDTRITSYNVCYTKLLRRDCSRLDDPRFQRRVHTISMRYRNRRRSHVHIGACARNRTVRSGFV